MARVVAETCAKASGGLLLPEFRYSNLLSLVLHPSSRLLVPDGWNLPICVEFLRAERVERPGFLGSFRFRLNRGTTLALCFLVLLFGKTAHTFPGCTAGFNGSSAPHFPNCAYCHPVRTAALSNREVVQCRHGTLSRRVSQGPASAKQCFPRPTPGLTLHRVRDDSGNFSMGETGGSAGPMQHRVVGACISGESSGDLRRPHDLSRHHV